MLALLISFIKGEIIKMYGRHYGEKNRSVKKRGIVGKIFIFLLFLVFVSAMVFSGVKIFNWVKENQSSAGVTNDVQKAVSTNENNKYEVDFKSLKEKNPDTVAWFKLEGTNIEYPVVKTTDNEFYMNHSFDKSKNSAGWVFMDYRNKLDGKDQNMVIYGHNRRDGSMFGTLKKILTKDWLENTDNFIIPFITENEKLRYQVFSVYKIEKENYYITTNFKTNPEFQEFIDKIKSRSIKNFGIIPRLGDSILTLSTCADNDNYRVVLHAKKISEY